MYQLDQRDLGTVSSHRLIAPLNAFAVYISSRIHCFSKSCLPHIHETPLHYTTLHSCPLDLSYLYQPPYRGRITK
jgi:hypothetical protein